MTPGVRRPLKGEEGMGRVLLNFLGVAGFVLLASSAGLACTCALPPTSSSIEWQVGAARKEAQAVFSGEVVGVSEGPQDSFNVVVRLRVKRSWKGSRADEVSIVTGRGGGDCGYPFEVGGSYLVYAYAPKGGSLGTNICRRTARLADAGADLKVLGKGRPPAKAKRASTSGRP